MTDKASLDMRDYELAILLDSSETEAKKLIDGFLTAPKESGAKIDNIDIWPKRRLAYEINKHKEAVYAFIKISAEPKVVSELNRVLGLSDKVIRTKLIKAEDAHIVFKA